MSAPQYDPGIIIAMFDSFCKVAIRNASRNYAKKMQNTMRREVRCSDPSGYLQGAHTNFYPSEQSILTCGEFSCVAYNERLFEALQALPEKQRAVLILSFWYDQRTYEIAKIMEVTVRTVHKLRRRAYAAIRKLYSDKKEED